MRRLLIHLCFALLSLPPGIVAQTPTRNQLLQLYHKANVAKNKSDYETAIDRYGDIIRLVPQLPEPYLYIAELYDANSSGNRKNQELAIFFYRKYIDVQLDDNKTISAQQRLVQLESAISISHYEEYLKEEETKADEEYARFEVELAEEVILDYNEADTILLESGTTEIGGLTDSIARITTISNINQSTLIAIKNDNTGDSITIEKPYVPVQDKIYTIKTKKQELLFPLEIVPENTIDAMWNPSTLDISELSGRWVSASRLPNNREIWIIDIDARQDDIKVSLSPNSGILNVKEWNEKHQLLSSPDYYGIDNTKYSVSDNDIYTETLQMVKEVDSPVVSINKKDESMQFSYRFILDYKGKKQKYDWVKHCGKGLLTIGKEASKLLGGIFGISSIIPDNTTKSENKPVTTYIADINFNLHQAPAGLVGVGREIFAGQTGGECTEKNVHSFTHLLYKVDDQYSGHSISDFTKNREQIKKEKELIKTVKKGAKENATLQYLLAILYSYSVGEKETKDNTDKVYKQMMKAAKAGSLSAAEYVIKHCYSVASDNSYSKAIRKKKLAIAQEWCNRIYPAAPGLTKCLQAQYAIDNNCDYDHALQLIREAVESAKDNGSFHNRLGELYLNSFNNEADAIRCFVKAAELNDNNAMLNIARLHRHGNNVSEYVKWLVKAFENGNLQATDGLAEIYFKGIGVKQDYQRGMKYADLYKKRIDENWKIYVSNIKPMLLKIID